MFLLCYAYVSFLLAKQIGRGCENQRSKSLCNKIFIVTKLMLALIVCLSLESIVIKSVTVDKKIEDQMEKNFKKFECQYLIDFILLKP